MLVTGSFHGKVRFWQIDKIEPILSLDEENFPTRIAISSDGLVFATSSGTNTKIRQVNNGELIRVISGYRDAITDIDIAPNGTILAVAVRDYQTEKPNQPAHRVDLWRVADGKIIQTLQGPSVHVQSVAFSPDGTKVATSGGNSAWVWQVDNGDLFHTLKGHTGEVETVTFSPDGKTLATGSWDSTIKLWQVDNGMLLHTLKGHLGDVLTVEFSSDGKMIASGGQDGVVRLWQVKNGEFIRKLKSGFGRWVWNASFSPDGTMVATASDYGPVRVYEIEK